MQNEIENIYFETLFYNELQKEYKPKTNTFCKQEILKNMTDSEVAEIILDKNKELKQLKEELKNEIKTYRWDSREILILLSKDREEEIEKIIKYLNFQLKLRDPLSTTESISIDDLKSKIDIVSLIELLTWTQIKYTRRLIQCPLRWHDDSTASFKIYENTDSFYCPGCRRGGDHINFIEHYYWINTKDAIKKFKLLIK